MMRILYIVAIATSFLCLNNTVFGKSLEKFYVSMISVSGTVYHIFPQEIKYTKNQELKLNVSTLKYDYTYLNSTDSVDMLFTMSYDTLCRPLSLKFNNDNNKYPISIIYIDSKGKDFVYRVKCSFSFDKWMKIYNSIIPMKISLMCEDGIELVFCYQDRKWKDLQRYFKELFELIEAMK